VAKPKNIVVFAFTYVLEGFALFYGDFCMDLYRVDSDEVMKQSNEALNASSLQCLSSVKRFIDTIFFLRVQHFIVGTFYAKTLFKASSPLLFKRKSLLDASSPLLFKITLPTSACVSYSYLQVADVCIPRGVVLTYMSTSMDLSVAYLYPFLACCT
jgi:hypothetical protein